MNKRIMEAVEEIESIRNATMREYPPVRIANHISWKNYEEAGIEPPDIERQYYYKVNKKCIPLERAISDRTRMIDVLRRFYCAHSCDHDGIDDFVTLFGAYCNYYIRFNLHQAISEDKDFGISALWDVVTDEKLQKHLSLLQQGIFNGMLEGEKEFLEAFKLAPEYSLSALYLFIRNYKRFQEAASNQRQIFEDKMLYYAEHMNKALFNYCVGNTELLNNRRLYKERFILPKWFYAPLPYFETRQSLSKASKKMRIPCTNQTVTVTPKFFDFLREIENRDDDRFDLRSWFLSIPYLVGEDEGGFGNLLEAMLDRYKTREVMKTVQQEKDEIVQDFSHTYQNITTTALYDVAMTLLDRTDEADIQLGRTALLEYTRKETLTKDVYMMKLKYEHNTEKLWKILRRSCVRPASGVHTIREVVSQALLMCLISAFYDSEQKHALAMFDNMEKLWPSVGEIVRDFEQKAIQQGTDCVEWLQTKGIDLIVNVDTKWMALGFQPNGYASVLLRNILTELFVNLFKYGDLQKPVTLSLQVDNNESPSAKEALCIRIENFLLDGMRRTSDSQIGLHAMGKMLQVLWNDECENSINAKYEEDTFVTDLRLPLTVFSWEEE